METLNNCCLNTSYLMITVTICGFAYLMQCGRVLNEGRIAWGSGAWVLPLALKTFVAIWTAGARQNGRPLRPLLALCLWLYDSEGSVLLFLFCCLRKQKYCYRVGELQTFGYYRFLFLGLRIPWVLLFSFSIWSNNLNMALFSFLSL